MRALSYTRAYPPPPHTHTQLGGPMAILKYQATRTMTLVVDESVQLFGGRALTASGMGKKVEMVQPSFPPPPPPRNTQTSLC